MKKIICFLTMMIAFFSFQLYFDAFHENLRLYYDSTNLSNKYKQLDGASISLDTNELSEYTSSETFALLQKYAK